MAARGMRKPRAAQANIERLALTEKLRQQRAYDTFVTEARKVGELYWAVVQDAYAPFEQPSPRGSRKDQVEF